MTGLRAQIASGGPVLVDEMLAGLESYVEAALAFMELGPARDSVGAAVAALTSARRQNTQVEAMNQGGPGHWGQYGPTVASRTSPG